MKNQELMNLDIEKEIAKRAHSYAGEWRFDTEKPDMGSALALAYMRMVKGTILRFSKIMQKNRIEFCNELCTELLPAVPASGYIQFSLVNHQVDGCEVDRGTIVFADALDGQLRYETQQDLFVTPAEFDEIYQVSDYSDTIYCLKNKQQELDKDHMRLFSMHSDNKQSHAFYLSNELIMNLETSGYIAIEFYAYDDVPVNISYLNMLCDPQKVECSFYSENGWHAFSSMKVEDNRLILYKGKDVPELQKCELENKENFWVRFQIHKAQEFLKFQACDIKMSGWNTGIAPTTVYGAGEECNIHEFFPFGEKLELYDEVYFGCGEALNKKGAQITLSFAVDFIKIPIDDTENTINWEWIMRRSDFKPDKQYDVTIERVMWEYYNGHGWTSLFEDRFMGQVFSTENGTMGQYKTLQFTCPMDMSPVLVNAVETCYIRARVLKINNLYKTLGNYIIPIMSNVAFQYNYETAKLPVDDIILENNLERSRYHATSLFGKMPVSFFSQTGQKEPALYFRSEVAPVGNPIKMLFCLNNYNGQKSMNLLWEYWSEKGWKNLNMVDETEGLSKTGVITFSGNPDFRKKGLFSTEGYWIRATDVVGYYRDPKTKSDYPVLQNIHMNTTQIRYVEMDTTEFFRMAVYKENATFPLEGTQIYECSLYVDEQGELTEQEEKELLENHRLMQEFNESGMPVRSWVLWERMPDFVQSTSEDRHYVVHMAEGMLVFGDGEHGRIPSSALKENIKIQYRCGGGAHTNVQEGAVSKMDRSIGYISSVRNPQQLTGGSDPESVQEALARTAAMIRNQNRAVTARDYEELAMCATRSVQKVKCFHGYGEKGELLQGAVTLVILPKQIDLEQVQFSRLREDVLEYMSRRISVTLINNHKFFVTAPVFVNISLSIELSIRDFNLVFQVKREILKRLEQFIKPENWEIGTIPNIIQIRNEIRDIKEILYIRNIRMGTYIQDAGIWQEIDRESLIRNQYILPVNGEHEITITVE